MQSLIDIVGGEEVSAQHPLEAFTEQVLDHLTASGVMVLVVAQLRRTHTPDVAIAAIFSPPRFIGLHGWAGANLLLERQPIGAPAGAVARCNSPTISPLLIEAHAAGQIGLDLSHR